MSGSITHSTGFPSSMVFLGQPTSTQGYNNTEVQKSGMVSRSPQLPLQYEAQSRPLIGIPNVSRNRTHSAETYRQFFKEYQTLVTFNGNSTLEGQVSHLTQRHQNLGQQGIQLASELGIVHSVDKSMLNQSVDLQKNELKLARTVFKFPNATTGPVKDVIEALGINTSKAVKTVTDELSKLTDKFPNARNRPAHVAKRVFELRQKLDILSGKVSVDLSGLSEKLQAKYVSFGQNTAKPQLNLVKQLKGITSMLGIVGDIIDLADAINRIANPVQNVVDLSSPTNNAEQVRAAGRKLFVNSAVLGGLIKTVEIRTAGIKQATQALQPDSQQRWEYALWLLNEGVMAAQPKTAVPIFGDKTNGRRTSFYPEFFPGNLPPMTSELNNAQFGMSKTSSLPGILADYVSGDGGVGRQAAEIQRQSFENRRDIFFNKVELEAAFLEREDGISHATLAVLNNAQQVKQVMPVYQHAANGYADAFEG